MKICRGTIMLIVTCVLISSAAAQERTAVSLSTPTRTLKAVPQAAATSGNPNSAPVEETELVKRLRQLAKLRDQPTTDSARVQTSPQIPTVRPASHQTHSTAIPQPIDNKAPAAAFLDLTQPTTDDTATSATEPSDTDMFIQFGVWTVIILCCCGLTVLSIRLWQRRNGILPATNSSSRVLETVALGPRRSISLVRLGDVRAIVGCDATGVTSIVLAPESFDISLAETELEDTEHIRN